ncbi:hypothetical protein Peur_010103 [Populus x canadensis]
MIQSQAKFCGHRREDRRYSCSRRRPCNRKIEFDCGSIHRIFPGKRISFHPLAFPLISSPIAFLSLSSTLLLVLGLRLLTRMLQREPQWEI